jgi:hypothetical protein
MIDLDDLFVRLVPNLSVNEMITPCENGYSVYIKEELPEEKKVEALYHAYVHKKNNDFTRSDIQDIEARAHYNLESLAEFRKALREAQAQYEC